MLLRSERKRSQRLSEIGSDTTHTLKSIIHTSKLDMDVEVTEEMLARATRHGYLHRQSATPTNPWTRIFYVLEARP